jgi:hypothetical protein
MSKPYPIVADSLELARKAHECKSTDVRARARRQIRANLEAMTSKAAGQFFKLLPEAHRTVVDRALDGG